MIKTTIGELKLSPLKEEGKFVFYNDTVTINGKVSKGDKIKIYVREYEPVNGRHQVKNNSTLSALLVVRGQEQQHDDTDSCQAVEDYYDKVTEVYKNQFYFGKAAK